MSQLKERKKEKVRETEGFGFKTAREEDARLSSSGDTATLLLVKACGRG